MSMIAKITDFIKGTGYMEESGLAYYHMARAVMNARRRENQNDRLIGIREALNRTRVTSWVSGDKIELRNGSATLSV